MMVYKSMDFWATYNLPIPIRKWLIKRWNKYVQQESDQPSSDRPLSEVERRKMIKQALDHSNQPKNMTNFLDPKRNK